MFLSRGSNSGTSLITERPYRHPIVVIIYNLYIAIFIFHHLFMVAILPSLSINQILWNTRPPKWQLLAIFTLNILCCLYVIIKKQGVMGDFPTYLEQARLFLRGERNYANIFGELGPIQYPALHIYIYALINRLTNAGSNFLASNLIFSGLYLICALCLFSILRIAKAPLIAYALVSLSRRSCGLIVLGKFNDALTMTLTYAAILKITTIQDSNNSRNYLIALFLLGLALGIKMNTILHFPAFGLILVKEKGWRFTILAGIALVLIPQVLIGLPFLSTFPRPYLSMAFNIKRKFAYTESINWYFLGREIFEKLQTSSLLSSMGMICLLAFAHFRWLAPNGLTVIFPRPPSRRPSLPEKIHWTIRRKLQVILEANLIGILFMPSLHVQFSLWYLQLVPLLLFATDGRRLYRWGDSSQQSYWRGYAAVAIWGFVEGALNLHKHPCENVAVSLAVVTGLTAQLLS